MRTLRRLHYVCTVWEPLLSCLLSLERGGGNTGHGGRWEGTSGSPHGTRGIFFRPRHRTVILSFGHRTPHHPPIYPSRTRTRTRTSTLYDIFGRGSDRGRRPTCCLLDPRAPCIARILEAAGCTNKVVTTAPSERINYLVIGHTGVYHASQFWVDIIKHPGLALRCNGHASNSPSRSSMPIHRSTQVPVDLRLTTAPKYSRSPTISRCNAYAI